MRRDFKVRIANRGTMAKGLTCGIEIHQRLATGKLFCRCPSGLAEEKPDLVFRRFLRASASETGEMDRAALEEQERRRVFEYYAYERNCCLVETDEEPPAPADPEALRIVLGLCQQFDMDVFDRLHVMRKIVVDGSNTSGFQRTMLVGSGGSIETSQGPVGITTVALEEESAGIVGEEGGVKTYRLDRLGIPLIEITTDPDIKSPGHAKEVAEKLGTMLRATGKVARGIGTIRQDVNVSIPGGARVEIKGAQELRKLPQLIEYEMQRQEKLLEILAEMKKRKIGKLKGKPIDVTNVLSKTEAKLIKKGLERGDSVFGLLLEKHEGLLGTELQPGRRYGSEFSDYAKTAGVKGIIHSDEDFGKYGISDAEDSAVRKALGAKKCDAFALVVAPAETAQAALVKVVGRANVREIPGETRKARPDSTSSYLRPTAGRARMYPETDLKPVDVTEELLREAKEALGGGFEEKEAKLKEVLAPDMAKRMLKSRNLELFWELVEMGVEPKLAAGTLEETLVTLRREGKEIKEPGKALAGLFKEYNKGLFVRAAIPDVLRGMAGGKGAKEVVEEKGLAKISGKELKELIEKEGRDFGALMKKYRLRMEPKELKEALEG